MKLRGNTILITGGTSGIGLTLASRFFRDGNTVIVCGRRKERLDEIENKYPGIYTRVCDLSKESERVALFEWAQKKFPKLNVLVNNAGIQRRFQVPPAEPWSETAQELKVNLEAPIHLSFLFTPHLEKQKNSMIINISSGLAFAPISFMPVYCATKAAIHSFTLSIRHVLVKKSIEVVEIVPPAVNTDLGGAGLHLKDTPLDLFADAVMIQLGEGKKEITYGTSAKNSMASREELDAIFLRMNP
ncbi:MAG: SDR family oxidoreductase [Minisyncoccia bacterium]